MIADLFSGLSLHLRGKLLVIQKNAFCHRPTCGYSANVSPFRHPKSIGERLLRPQRTSNPSLDASAVNGGRMFPLNQATSSARDSYLLVNRTRTVDLIQLRKAQVYYSCTAVPSLH